MQVKWWNVLTSWRLKSLILKFSLFSENSPAHLKHSLKTLSTSLRILTESFDTGLLYLVFKFLPATTERGDLSLLLEIRSGVGQQLGWSINNRLANIQHIRPRQISRTHRDFLRDWIDIRNFVNVRKRFASEERDDPTRSRLIAGD